MGYINKAKSDSWTTPGWVFQLFDWTFKFTCDVASSDENCLVEQHFTESDDALSLPWSGRCFCNPPYSQLGKFISKAASEVNLGHAELVVLLIPSRTDTKAWHEHIFNQANVSVHFIAGRLRFGEGTAPAPFPSAIIVMHRKYEKT